MIKLVDPCDSVLAVIALSVFKYLVSSDKFVFGCGNYSCNGFYGKQLIGNVKLSNAGLQQALAVIAVVDGKITSVADSADLTS